MTKFGWLFIFLSSVFAVGANLMLRAGLDRAGGFSGGILQFILLFKEPLFDFGLIFYGLATIVWLRVLSSEPLSIAYPILVSTTFALVTISAAVIFNESLNLPKVFGMFCILIGILLMGQS